MKRSIRAYLSPRTLQQARYIPSAIGAVSNWWEFLANRMGLKNSCPVYRFRNGLAIKTREPADTDTIFDILIRKDYGEAPKNGVVIDIGANMGSYALFAAWNSPDARVYAFEPDPTNYALMRENIAMNGLADRVIVSDVAVTGKRERREFFVHGGPHGSMYRNDNNPLWTGSGEAIDVECWSLDEVFKKYGIAHCDVLKLDCEGSEFEIFEATSEESFKKINRIRMEYHYLPGRTDNVNDLILFFRQKGFAVEHHEPSHSLLWVARSPALRV